VTDRVDLSRERESAFVAAGSILRAMSSGQTPSPPPPNRLREWRKQRGLTMAEVAEKIEVKTATVARHETGGAQVTLGQLYDYARIYRVRVEDLLTTGASPAHGMGELIELGQRLSPAQRLAIVQTWKAFAETTSPFEAEPRKRRQKN
jgi:transcriptional regulator with XRE-family HTH domain